MSIDNSSTALAATAESPLSLDDEGFLSVEFPEIVIEAIDDQAPAAPVYADEDLKAHLEAELELGAASPEIKPNAPQIRFKTVDGKLQLILPKEQESTSKDGLFQQRHRWEAWIRQLQQHLGASARFWQHGTLVNVQAGDRLLDSRQLHELEEALKPHDLVLHSVFTYRRQTAIAVATAGFAVEQGTVAHSLTSPPDPEDCQLDDPLYVRMTLRSGTEIRHHGSVIIFGDVNAGGEIIADGDILVWGKLKGLAHAGAKGNSQAVIMALHLEATQLRIADFIARVDTPSTNFCPEVAHVSQTGVPGICIVRASDYSSVKYS